MSSMNDQRKVAYFSMEVGISSEIPTYSGGLGVLAGDTVKAAADLRVPMVVVTLLHRKGYCRQILDEHGNQTEEPVDWVIKDYLKETPARTTVTVEGKKVRIRAWTRDVEGLNGYRIPVYFLDTDLPENHKAHQGLTHHLYGGDERYRLCQEKVLGVGGVRMLRALGYDAIRRFHMNEGHASLLACELLTEEMRADNRTEVEDSDVEAVRQRCVFTTHTPVPAGHDQFPLDVVKHVLQGETVQMLTQLDCLNGSLNMTYLALQLSKFVNGVARRHGEISREMFAPYSIDSITNGVHARTWVCDPLRKVFDRHTPAWEEDSYSLRNAARIPSHEVWDAHVAAKVKLIEHVKSVADTQLDPEAFTIGFARRVATYKRADMFFQNLSRLRSIYDHAGKFQIIYAGKAHPRDGGGKDLIRRIFGAKKELADKITVVYLPDYNMDICKMLVSGVDIWLNTPEPPMEASGTSGMKAALNGVPSFSVLDGWWVEGWIEDTTGWIIGSPDVAQGAATNRDEDVEMMYDKLEHVILPMYFRDRSRFVSIMKHCIALNGSFFNTQRMMNQYVLKAYFL